jgi:hypothetical protein
LAGKSPAEAVTNFARPLQLAASCVTRDVLDLHGGYHPSEAPHALTLGAEEPVRLRGAGELALSVTLHYRIVEASGARGPWKVSTVGYLYALDDAEGREILGYHWHPHGRGEITRPHLHLGAGAMVGREHLPSAHLPTGRVALEALLRCAIADLGVEPLRSDWRDVLDAAEAGFETWRTWPSPEARPDA